VKLSHAFKVYPKAIGWSVLLSSCLIMEGYQTSVVGSCKSDGYWNVVVVIISHSLFFSSLDLAYPAFKERFGVVAPNGEHVIQASWQNGISGATNVGEIIGLQVRSRNVLFIPCISCTVETEPFAYRHGIQARFYSPGTYPNLTHIYSSPVSYLSVTAIAGP
jgi:hypothetical protein